jgi:hypothetical protein
MSTKKKSCGFDNKTKRCNKHTKENQEKCELSSKNNCIIKTEYKSMAKKKPPFDLSKFVIGQSSARSQHGISLSLLKSAMQKYIRRSETEKAIKCLLEVDTLFILEMADDKLVIELNKQSKQKAAPFKKDVITRFGKTQRTNIANRLLVICSEEVNINGNTNVPIEILKLYKSWRLNRHIKSSTDNLIKMIIILSNSKKYRLISCLKSAFTLPAYYVSDIKAYDEWYDNTIAVKYKSLMKRSDYKDKSIETLLDKKETEKVFRWYSDNVKNDNKLPNIMWKLIKKKASEDSKQSIYSLHEIYKLMSHQEKPIYLYHAMLLFCYEKTLNWDEKIEDPIVPKISEFKSPSELNESYIVDLHVHGKKTLADYIKLLKESFVLASDKTERRFVQPYYDEIYRDIKIGVGFYLENKEFPTLNQVEVFIQYYFKDKIEQKVLEEHSKLRDLDKLKSFIKLPETVISEDKKQTFIDYLKSMPLAQQRTGRGKKFTYIDFKNEKIVKGPYKQTEFSMLMALKYNHALEILDKSTNVKTSWKWKKLIKLDDKYYLETDFVSDKWIKSKEEREKRLKKKEKESWKGGESYYYFERNSKVLGLRIKDMIDDKVLLEDTEENKKKKLDVLQHLYHRYILGVGDTHTSNILEVSKKKSKQVIAGIDMEEFRRNFHQTTLLALLLNRETKLEKQAFEPHLYEIKLLDWKGKKLVEKLKPMFLTEQIIEMKKRDIQIRHILKESLN